jgi:hypothetical protein
MILRYLFFELKQIVAHADAEADVSQLQVLVEEVFELLVAVMGHQWGFCSQRVEVTDSKCDSSVGESKHLFIGGHVLVLGLEADVGTSAPVCDEHITCEWIKMIEPLCLTKPLATTKTPSIG